MKLTYNFNKTKVLRKSNSNELNSNAKSKLTVFILLGVLILTSMLIPQVSSDLGTFKQNSCVNIRVLNNCSINTLIEVSNNNQTYIINKNMTNLGGQTFNYSFCNTSNIDTYTYSWNPNCYDCASGNCGNSFSITSNGGKISLSNIILVIVFLVLGGLFLFISLTFEKEKYIIKTAFILFSIMMGLLAINSARIIASESLSLNIMAQSGFIIVLVILSFLFLYILIYATINTFKQLKQKGGGKIKWDF